MRDSKPKVVLITGASSGIGRATARFLAGKNYKVYGTSRKNRAFTNPLEPQPSMQSGFFKMLQMDVWHGDSIKQAVDHVIKHEGQVDILINSAGYAHAGAVEDTTMEEAKRQFDTNFFGVMEVCRQVLPYMRQKKNGTIINISSVAGLIPLPFHAMYCASKAALESMTQSLRMEVKPFGIHVLLIEPGDTNTDFTRNRQCSTPLQNPSVYNNAFRRSVEAMIQSELKSPGPEKVVKEIDKILRTKNPPVRKVVGMDYNLFYLLKKLLPDPLVEYILGKLY